MLSNVVIRSKSKNSNVTDIYFGIDNEKIKGEIEIVNNTYKCYGIFPGEINTGAISEEIDFEYEF